MCTAQYAKLCTSKTLTLDRGWWWFWIPSKNTPCPFALVLKARLNDNPREMWLIELKSVLEKEMTQKLKNFENRVWRTFWAFLYSIWLF